MRSRQHTGRPGTQVIPDRWQGTHGRVIAKTWTVCVEIRRPGAVKGAFNPTTGTYPMTPPAPHFTGMARVQALATRDQAQNAADQAVTELRYLVAVSLEANEVQVDDVVKITGVKDDSDQTLVNREVTVSSLARGSLAWERDLTCIDDLG